MAAMMMEDYENSDYYLALEPVLFSLEDDSYVYVEASTHRCSINNNDNSYISSCSSNKNNKSTGISSSRSISRSSSSSSSSEANVDAGEDPLWMPYRLLHPHSTTIQHTHSNASFVSLEESTRSTAASTVSDDESDTDADAITALYRSWNDETFALADTARLALLPPPLPHFPLVGWMDDVAFEDEPTAMDANTFETSSSSPSKPTTTTYESVETLSQMPSSVLLDRLQKRCSSSADMLYSVPNLAKRAKKSTTSTQQQRQQHRPTCLFIKFPSSLTSSKPSTIATSSSAIAATTTTITTTSTEECQAIGHGSLLAALELPSLNAVWTYDDTGYTFGEQGENESTTMNMTSPTNNNANTGSTTTTNSFEPTTHEEFEFDEFSSIETETNVDDEWVV